MINKHITHTHTQNDNDANVTENKSDDTDTKRIEYEVKLVPINQSKTYINGEFVAKPTQLYSVWTHTRVCMCVCVCVHVCV